MIALGQRPHTDEEREAAQARRSAKAFAREERKRLDAMRVLAEHPNGSGPLPTLPTPVLLSLVSRGLAERRYVLTRDGRRELERHSHA